MTTVVYCEHLGWFALTKDKIYRSSGWCLKDIGCAQLENYSTLNKSWVTLAPYEVLSG
jgi:hypothetical protein